MRLVAREREWISVNIKMNQDGEISISDFQKFVMTAPGPGSGKEGATTTSNNCLKLLERKSLVKVLFFALLTYV